MTNREFFVAITSGSINDEVISHAKAELVKLDERNAKRNASATKRKNEENAPIIQAIMEYLASHPKALSTEIASAVGQSTSKVVGVCGVLFKDGMLTKEAIAVKGKGKQTAWSVVVSE